MTVPEFGKAAHAAGDKGARQIRNEVEEIAKATVGSSGVGVKADIHDKHKVIVAQLISNFITFEADTQKKFPPKTIGDLSVSHFENSMAGKIPPSSDKAAIISAAKIEFGKEDTKVRILEGIQARIQGAGLTAAASSSPAKPTVDKMPEPPKKEAEAPAVTATATLGRR